MKQEKWTPKRNPDGEVYSYNIDEGSDLNRGRFSMYTELETTGKPIEDGRLDLAVWLYGGDRYEYGLLWDGAPEGEIKRRFPFCQYAQIFCATGGEGFTVFDLEKEYTVDPEEFVSMGKYTPFDGENVTGRCVLTAVNGKVAWLDETYC